MWRKKCFPTALCIRDVWIIKLKTAPGQKVKGSLTVEASIVVPVVLLCIFLLVDAGIQLYAGTTELVKEQEMWEDFHPAQKFRKLELLEEVFGASEVIGGEVDGSKV